MKHMATLGLLLLVVGSVVTVSVADELGDHLTALGVGSTAPKYPDVGATGTYQDGVYTLYGWGHDYYWGWDRGAFAYYDIGSDGDFSFSAVIDDAEYLFATAPKVGICVRSGLVGNDKALQLRYDGFFGGSSDGAQVSWFYRFAEGAETTEFCTPSNRTACFIEGGTGVTQINGTKLTIARVGTDLTMYVNDEQVAADQTLRLGSGPLYAGLIFSAGGGDTPLKDQVKFRDLACTGVCPEGVGTAASAANSRLLAPQWTVSYADGIVRMAPSSDGRVAAVRICDASGRTVVQGDGNRFAAALTAGCYVAEITTTAGQRHLARLSVNP